LRAILSLAACAVVAIPVVSAAAESLNVRPGLWDFTQTMTTSGAPIYIEMMTPAQRAEYAKSWAKDVGKAHTDTDQQCITAQDIKEAKLFQAETQAGKQCTQKVVKESKTAWSGTSDCKDAKTATHTQIDYTAPTPDRFTGTVKASTTSPNGTTVFEFKFSGKWVGASCPNEDETSDESAEDAEESGQDAE
jgi:hypothetical protein